MQKAKEAKAVGILVGTLGAGRFSPAVLFANSLSANYLPMIKRLKYVLQRVGKKVGRTTFLIFYLPGSSCS